MAQRLKVYWTKLGLLHWIGIYQRCMQQFIMFDKIWKALAIVKHVLGVGHHHGIAKYDELWAFGTHMYFYTWSVLHMCNIFCFAHIMSYHYNFLCIYIRIIPTYLAWPSMFLYCHVYFGGLHNIVWDVTIFLESSSLCCLIMPKDYLEDNGCQIWVWLCEIYCTTTTLQM